MSIAEFHKGKPVHQWNFLSGNNSTNTALNNGSIFIGEWEKCIHFNSIKISAITDKISTLYIDYSSDGINVDFTQSHPLNANIYFSIFDKIITSHFRIRITNSSGSNQTYLRMTAILSYQFDTKLDTFYSTANSTTNTLNVGESWVGSGEDVSNYGTISIGVYSNVASNVLGLEFQASPDNVNWYTSDNYTIVPNTLKVYSLAPQLKYFRVKYTNDGSSQATFLIETTYRQTYIKSSSHRIGDTVVADDDAELVTAQIVGKTTGGGGGYVAVKVTPSGALTQESTVTSSVLPTGASTSALQTTINNTLSNLEVGFKQIYRDPFGRLITSSPKQIFSFDHTISKLTDVFNETITGSATSTHNANTVSVDLSVTTANADKVVRQTYRSFEYTRGNGHMYLFSLNPGGAAKTNNVREWGCGDSENGAFFRLKNANFSIFKRSKTSGSVVETEVLQNNFNTNTLLTLDFATQNLYFIMYSWLGTNAIIYGVVINATIYILHILNNGNVSNAPWSQTGSLPINFLNENIDLTATTTTMSITCGACFSLGSSNEIRSKRTITSGASTVSITATELVVAGIRLKSTAKYKSAIFKDLELLPVSGTSSGWFKIILRPTLTGASWTSNGEITEILTGTAPTYTGGIILHQGHFSLSATGRVPFSIDAQTEGFLGTSLAGVSDSVILVIRTDSGNGTLHYDIDYEEIL